MPTQRDYILGRLAVDLGYLTHEQVGRAFLDHQRMVEHQGMKVTFAEMLVVQGFLTGDRARELEEAAAVEDGGNAAAAEPTPAPTPAKKAPATKKRRSRRPSTRSAPPARPAPSNHMWIAAAGGAGILLLGIIAVVLLGGDPPEDPLPPEPGPIETLVMEEHVAGTSVTETAAAEAPDEDPADETPPDRAEVEPSEDGLFARLRRESEERAAAATESGRTDDSATGNEPDIAELLVAAEADAERTADDPPVAPPALPATGIRRGLVAHLTFDEGRGTVAMDTSGRGANGTVKGGTWARGCIGGALEFDGVNDHVKVPGLKGWTPTAFTVAFWLRPDAIAGYNQQIGAPQGWGRFRFHTGAEGNVWCGTTTGSRFQIRPGTVTVGDWQHFAYTFDNGAARLYKNGVELESATHSMPVEWTGFEIGQNGAQTIDGGADDVRVYERALAPAEVKTLADPVRLAAAEKAAGEPGTASPRPPAAPAAPVATGIRRGLLAHWTFDEGRGTTAADSSGHNVSGRLTGARWARGRIGAALEFDGEDANVSTTRAVELAGRSFTLSAWVRHMNTGAVEILLAQGRNANGNGLHFGFRETDRFTIDFWYDALRTKASYTDSVRRLRPR
ncbi:MAG: LamG domain-containing protein [Planctomycetota bacterium]|jgi:hypothetical protein